MAHKDLQQALQGVDRIEYRTALSEAMLEVGDSWGLRDSLDTLGQGYPGLRDAASDILAIQDSTGESDDFKRGLRIGLLSATLALPKMVDHASTTE